MLIKIARKIVNKYYYLFNKQYYKYNNIHQTVKFSAEKPGKVYIIGPDNITIGKGTVINAGAHINARGKVSIGKYVHAGINLTIYSSNHNFRSTKGIPYDDTNIDKLTTIKDFVWLGANVSVVPGTTIGEGAVVGIGSIVTKDVPDCAIVGGNPATVIGWRDKNLFMQLKRDGKFY